MYGRQGNSSNSQPPPPWLVRAEVTIRHGATPVTSESGQPPVGVSSTVTDSNGVRMVYRWNTNRSTPSTVPVTTSVTTVPSSSSFGFQRGNIVFTSTPPPRPSPGSFTIPRSGSSGNDESISSRGRGANVSDSGYNSEQFSPQSYSSLPSRRPVQQYNRRCKSTCSIVLSTAGLDDGSRKETVDKLSTNESTKHSYDESWRHRSTTHQHAFSRYHFSTVPEVCEECTDATTSSAVTTHFCSKVQDKVSSKVTAVSKDAASQTTDVESRGSSSTVNKGSRVRRKAATGLEQSDEQKKKKQETHSPSTPTGTTSSCPPGDSEKSDSSTKDDSAKRKSRTVHIDVYCTGSDEDESSDSLSENECDTPLTVFENPDVRVTHTQATGLALPRGFQDEKAFLKRASERRFDNFKNAPMRMPSLASSKGYESDDVLSSLYPSQFSSCSALRDLDSAPWSAASSNAAIPFDFDSIATSAKDTFSDIESLVNSKASLTPCDSFEYANTSDRDRIRRMEEAWSKTEKQKSKTWRSPQIERQQLLQNRKMKEYLEKHDIGWSSGESGDNSDESSTTVGWSFVSGDENQRLIKKNSTVRRTSRSISESIEKTASNVAEAEPAHKLLQECPSESSTRSGVIPHAYTLRENIGPFGSKSPSPHPSKVPSRVTSPFTTSQGEKTDHIIKASIFGTVVNAFRKPGHHIGPSKNPSCSCEHCRRYYEGNDEQEGARSLSEFERRMGFFRPQNERSIIRPIPKNPNN